MGGCRFFLSAFQNSFVGRMYVKHLQRLSHNLKRPGFRGGQLV